MIYERNFLKGKIELEDLLNKSDRIFEFKNRKRFELINKILNDENRN